jgi:hypothetical protein
MRTGRKNGRKGRRETHIDVEKEDGTRIKEQN